MAPETFEEWRERTAGASTATLFVWLGGLLALCIFVADVTGFWPLWFLALPALLVWTVVDWRRTRRRLGLERRLSSRRPGSRRRAH